MVDVLNATPEEMELNYSANKSILIESKETCRVPIEIERCSMHQEDVALSPSVLSAKCRTHLSQQVRLEYSVTRPGKETKGTASIDSIPWTQMMLETILMSPVQWLVSANGNDLPIERPEVNCSVGETVNFKLGLHNHSHQPIMYTSLWIEMFQEQSNGLKNYDVESKIMREGKDKIYVEEVCLSDLRTIRTRKGNPFYPCKQIKAGDSVVHEVGYIFLSSGVYRVEVQSSGYDGNLVSASLLNSGANSLRAQEQMMTTASGLNYTSTDYGYSVAAGNEEPGCKTGPSLWKLLPAITVNVF